MGDTPSTSVNSTPYEKRGWCFFESSVSVAGAMMVLTVKDSDIANNEKSPVPVNPDRFDRLLRHKTFTSPNADMGLVSALYRRIFPRLAQHETLKAAAWGDDEARDFLQSMVDLPGLKNLIMAEDSSS